MPVMVPVVTPPAKDLAFRCQGKWVVCTVKVRDSGPVQWVNDSVVIEPMPFPDSPLPFLIVALPLEEVQLSCEPVFLSVSVVFPAFAMTARPGLADQCAATLALDDAAIALPALTPSTAARAALRTRTLPARLRIIEVFPSH